MIPRAAGGRIQSCPPSSCTSSPSIIGAGIASCAPRNLSPNASAASWGVIGFFKSTTRSLTGTSCCGSNLAHAGSCVKDPSRSNGLFPISGRPAMSVLSDITRSRGSLKPPLQDVASREADILEDGSRPQSLVQNSACRAERGIAGRKSCETSPALTEPNRPRLAQAHHQSSAQVSHLGTR